MRYVSTRGRAPALSFGEAMLTGLARDGGLYVPETVPALEARDIAALAGLSYESAAFRVMRPFVSGSFSDEELRAAIASAYAGFDHAARAPRPIGTRHAPATTGSTTSRLPDSTPTTTTKKALIKHFGGVKAIEAASVEQLCEVKGVGPKLARAIVDGLG